MILTLLLKKFVNFKRRHNADQQGVARGAAKEAG
jgi:hypothetical protein